MTNPMDEHLERASTQLTLRTPLHVVGYADSAEFSRVTGNQFVHVSRHREPNAVRDTIDNVQLNIPQDLLTTLGTNERKALGAYVAGTAKAFEIMTTAIDKNAKTAADVGFVVAGLTGAAATGNTKFVQKRVTRRDTFATAIATVLVGGLGAGFGAAAAGNTAINAGGQLITPTKEEVARQALAADNDRSHHIDLWEKVAMWQINHGLDDTATRKMIGTFADQEIQPASRSAA